MLIAQIVKDVLGGNGLGTDTHSARPVFRN